VLRLEPVLRLDPVRSIEPAVIDLTERVNGVVVLPTAAAR
jgi:hypothetical protein